MSTKNCTECIRYNRNSKKLIFINFKLIKSFPTFIFIPYLPYISTFKVFQAKIRIGFLTLTLFSKFALLVMKKGTVLVLFLKGKCEVAENLFKS